MYIADLHIHSRYSRATSRECTPEYLDLWARRKGIHLVGTGDFTHPAWREELEEKLEPAEEGLYVLKEEYRLGESGTLGSFRPRFVVSGEISSIYKKYDRVRKVHSLILLPGLEEAELIARKLESIGNIHSDGRPILGLDCRDLLEILLELCPRAIYVPAHIWTPHFSLFGAFSGFDTVEECFGDLSSHIYAMETGLSSDPPMNWRISALDQYQLISNSDAHSPAKLGREANLLDIELSYGSLKGAIEEGKGLLGTIEFFPEEGKYHFDGHRKCNLCLSPGEAEKYQGRCPICGRKLTLGVSHRVEQLADREEGYQKENAKRFESLVPLPEVIGASLGYSAASAKVQREYLGMVERLGPEFEILRALPLEDIRKVSGYLISEGIRRLREGKVERIPGFDGEYGTIKLFEPEEIEGTQGQMSFFQLLGRTEEPRREKNASCTVETQNEPAKVAGMDGKLTLNREQEEAVHTVERTVAVIAGPGTGKTGVLVSRILYLLENRRINPGEITAVTFTNKAAGEMRERLQKKLGKSRALKKVTIGTFHSICLGLLQEKGISFTLADQGECLDLADQVLKDQGLKETPKTFLGEVSRWKLQKAGFGDDGEAFSKQKEMAMEVYQREQRTRAILDFDDLILETLRIFEEEDREEKRFRYLFVDEFQDISPSQYRLIQAFNRKGRELFVIGDPDQSIYGFRGSDSECFEKLRRDDPSMKEIFLTENYRSSPQIIGSAVRVISENPGRERRLEPCQENGAPVRVVKAGGEMGEAIFVAKEINRLIGGIDMLDAQEKSFHQEGKLRSFNEIAILYRTHRQAVLLETCLQKEGIPYLVAGKEDYLLEREVRGTICFFRYLCNPEDILARELCLKLIFNLEDNSLSEAVLENLLEKYRKRIAKAKPGKLLEAWMEEMKLQGSEGLEKLLRAALFYKTMPEFLSALSLGVESDISRCGGKQYNGDAVTLMTLHGSKGLEFPVVILYGFRKGTIPFESENHQADTEEERRLFFVGMTRAKEELILTTSGEASPFQENLPEEYCVKEDALKTRGKEKMEQLSLFDFMD